jgi:UDP-N-acetylglucosamine diphosphorylase / glucose-1-phosphate thymidylyltransferase / UDP-N-acetylgalactosamine diphosphorylase / glucosamine-1-phosphate N-acetyltransferase / galactosamine-1-phosphate N-acetyltransferase
LHSKSKHLRMNLILFDQPKVHQQLRPVTLTRPISGIRTGILCLHEKWEKRFAVTASFLTEEYLSDKFPVKYTSDNLYVNASLLATDILVQAILGLNSGQVLKNNEKVLAWKSELKFAFGELPVGLEVVEFVGQVKLIAQLPDLFLNNAEEIESDFKLLTKGRVSAEINDLHTVVYGKENVFVEEGVNIKAAIINAETGPVYIGKNAVVQEGSLVIGPAAICEDSMVAFGAKIRPNTTLGPVCRVGGEVGNSIFHGYSNKAHDGFLGNSYIGEWCNLGANTNNSNLKNDYKEVKLHSYVTNGLVSTGELFCGTFMGDYSKAGISTMFNTGTSVGVSSNVYGSGFQEKFIQSFAWGGASEGYQAYRFDKAIEVINATMARRGKQLTEIDLKILENINKS